VATNANFGPRTDGPPPYVSHKRIELRHQFLSNTVASRRGFGEDRREARV